MTPALRRECLRPGGLGYLQYSLALVIVLAALVCGYGFAWIGHFVFEKNQPASFKQPLYSFMGDWKMFWQIVTGKIAF